MAGLTIHEPYSCPILCRLIEHDSWSTEVPDNQPLESWDAPLHSLIRTRVQSPELRRGHSWGSRGVFKFSWEKVYIGRVGVDNGCGDG